MAQSELLAEAYARFANGLGNLSNSLGSASENVKNIQEDAEAAAQKVKAAADKSTLQQLLTFQDSVYSNIDLDYPENDGFFQKLSRTYDTAAFNDLAQDALQKMENKMNELGVNDEVRNMWESEYKPAFQQKLNNAISNAYTQNYASKTAMEWQSKIDVVAASNIPYAKKREELQKHWNDVGLDDIVPYVNNMPTVDEAWRSMLTKSAVQEVDSYYALLKVEGQESADPSIITSQIIADLKSQIPEENSLTADEEFALQQTILKQVSAHETQLQNEANENIDKLAADLLKIPLNEGRPYDANDMLEGAARYGAINLDGSISKYWVSYLGQFENIVNKQIQQEEADRAAKEAADAAMAENQALWAKVDAVTTDDWVMLAQQYSMPELQKMGLKEQTGQVYFNNLKDEGKTTYTFGARKIETHYAGLAGAMAERLGITDTSSDQFRTILEQANSIGAYYEHINDIETRNEEIQKENEENAHAQALYDSVIALSDSDWLSAMATIGGGAQQTYEAYTGQLSEGYITNYEAFKRSDTYEFEDGTKVKTEYAPLVEQMAANLGIEDKKSTAYKALVLQANMLGSKGLFDDPNVKTPEQIAVEQIDAVIGLTEGDAAVAAAEVLSHEVLEPTPTVSQTTRPTEATNTPATASKPAEGISPAPIDNSVQEPASNTQEETTESVQPLYSPTEDDLGGLLSQMLGEDGLNYSELYKEKTYSFDDGTTITTKWSPVVERLKAKLEAQHGQLTSNAFKLLVQKVDTIGETTYLFRDSAKVSTIEDLLLLRSTGATTDEMRRAVVTAKAEGAITDDDIKQYNLLKEGAFSQLTEDDQSNLKDKLYDMLLEAYVGINNKKGDEDKKITRNIGSQRTWKDMVNDAYNMLETAFNANPAEFNANEETKMSEIVSVIYNEQMEKDVKTVMNYIGSGRINISEKRAMGTIVQGLYNPGWVDQDGSSRYVNYSAVLDDGVVVAIRENLGGQIGNTNFSWNNVDWNQVRNYAASQGTGNRSATYDSLSDMDKASIDLAIVKYMYEEDTWNTTAEKFDLNRESCYEIIIEGFGPALVDPKTKKLYMTDGDVKTSDCYNVANLTDEQIQTIEIVRTNPKEMINGQVMLQKDFVENEQWEYKGTNYEVINGTYMSFEDRLAGAMQNVNASYMGI